MRSHPVPSGGGEPGKHVDPARMRQQPRMCVEPVRHAVGGGGPRSETRAASGGPHAALKVMPATVAKKVQIRRLGLEIKHVII